MSQFREESAAEGEQHSGEAGLKETHPVCRRGDRHLVVQSVQNAVFFGHNFIHHP